MPRELDIQGQAYFSPGDGVWGKAALPALLVLTVAVFLTIGGTTLAVSKAASREESAAAARVFDLHPYMMPLGAVAALVMLAAAGRAVLAGLRAKAWSQVAAMALAGGAVVLAGYPLAWGAWAGLEPGDLPVAVKTPGRVCLTVHGQAALAGLVLAAGVWIARAWATRARQVALQGGAQAESGMTACLRRIRGREILAGLPGACLSAVAACLAVCLPLSLPNLLNMTGSAGDFLSALLLLTCCVAVLALLVCVVLQLVWLTWVSAVRASGADGKTSALVGALSAAMLFFLVRWGLWLAFSGEMGRLGLDLLFDAILLVGAMFYGLGVSRNLLTLSAESTPADAGQFIRLCILAGALLPVLPVVRLLKGRVVLGRRLILAGCLVMIVVAVALALPFFQKLDDHFTRINTTLSVLIVVVAIALGLALAPPHPRAWREKLLALGALVVPCLVVVATSAFAMANSRAEMNIYSPIGKATAQLLDPLLPSPRQSQGATSTALQATSRPPREPVMDTLKASRPLVVLVLWDACRPDHMNLFGYQRKTPPLLSTTPNLDKHKDEFLRFTTCFAHGTGTTCSMRQMLTSRYSSRWMLRTQGVGPFWLNDLAANGYDAFFLNVIGSDYNGISLDAFHRDLPAELTDRLACLACANCPASAREKLREKEKNIRTDYGDLPKASSQRLKGLGGKLKLVECNRQNEERCVEDLLAFIDSRPDGGKGTFAYLHPDATHSPWLRFPEVEDFGDDEHDRYDQCIRYCDYVTGKLIDGLKQRGIWDNTIFIMMADHGTGLTEHGVYGGFHPWFEQIRVPLVIKLPGVKGRAIDTMIGLMDLGPTLSAVFSDAPPERYEGRSLWPVILHDETWPDRVLFGLNAFADCYYLVTADGLHYIKHRANQYEQLFHWREEPLEKHSLMGVDKAGTDRARNLMNWFLNDYGRGRNYNDPDHYEPPVGEP